MRRRHPWLTICATLWLGTGLASVAEGRRTSLDELSVAVDRMIGDRGAAELDVGHARCTTQLVAASFALGELKASTTFAPKFVAELDRRIPIGKRFDPIVVWPGLPEDDIEQLLGTLRAAGPSGSAKLHAGLQLWRGKSERRDDRLRLGFGRQVAPTGQRGVIVVAGPATRGHGSEALFMPWEPVQRASRPRVQVPSRRAPAQPAFAAAR